MDDGLLVGAVIRHLLFRSSDETHISSLALGVIGANRVASPSHLCSNQRRGFFVAGHSCGSQHHSFFLANLTESRQVREHIRRFVNIMAKHTRWRDREKESYSVTAELDSDEKLVGMIDDMCHRLKQIHTPLGIAFRVAINNFIAELDDDQYSFASSPITEYEYEIPCRDWTAPFVMASQSN